MDGVALRLNHLSLLREWTSTCSPTVYAFSAGIAATQLDRTRRAGGRLPPDESLPSQVAQVSARSEQALYRPLLVQQCNGNLS